MSLTLTPLLERLKRDEQKAFDECVSLVDAYFHQQQSPLVVSEGSGTKNKLYPGPFFTGSAFDTFAGGGDHPGVANCFTSDDLVAVQCLSVKIDPHAALKILGPNAQMLSQILGRIPPDIDLVDADFCEKDSRGSESDPMRAARQLWDELEGIQDIGWVIAGKLCARKRPRLIPVFDNVVRDSLGKPSQFWYSLQQALRADESKLHTQLMKVRDAAGVGASVSVLRVFDVIVWMLGPDEASPRYVTQDDGRYGWRN